MSDKPQSKKQGPEMSDPRLAQPAAAPPLVRATQRVMWAGLIVLVVALAWWGIAGKLTWAPVILGAVGVLGAALWLVVNLPALRATAGTRPAQLILNSLSFVLFVLGILICVNIIAVRHHPRLDLTKGHIFSLAPQTHQVLRDLTTDVEMIAFLPEEAPSSAQARELVKLYSASSSRVKVTWGDYTNVSLLKQYDVKSPGTVVVKAGSKQEKVTDVSEQHLTSAVMSVITDKKLVVYFLTGHGECSITAGDNSVAELKNDLTNEQYEVKELELAKMPKPAVPADCTVLAIIGPQVAPAPQEMAAIEKWVDDSGKLLLALSPPPGPDFASLLAKRGVKVLGGEVIDPASSFMGDATAPMVAPTATDSSIMQGIDQLVLPICRGLQVTSGAQPPPMPGVPPQAPQGPGRSLLDSSPGSWLQPNLSAGLKKPAGAANGPFSMVALIDESPPPPPAMPGAPPQPQSDTNATRIVVIGSATALNDNLVHMVKFNSYLPLNAVAFLAKNTRIVAIPPKEEEQHNLLLTSTQKNFIIFIVMFFIPLAIIVAGVLVWWTRRR